MTGSLGSPALDARRPAVALAAAPAATEPTDHLELYADALEGDGHLVARDGRGRSQRLPVERWLAPASPADERLLDRTEGPVLDVGCGPGRHVHALVLRGVLALGVDVSPSAVRLARARGAVAVEGSIFDRVPGAGLWRSALLLDGNVGIGGEPGALLARVGALLAPGGCALVELGPPGGGMRTTQVRLERGDAVGAWFSWATVAADAVEGPARGAGFHVDATWCDDGRWFARLRDVRS
jgi:SAM-dependent methyltransferase